MYIIKNALRQTVRSKGRSILIGVVVLVLSVSSCIGLSIKEANKTLKNDYSNSFEITAALTPKNMRENGKIDLDTIKSIAENKAVKSFYYTSSVYFGAGDGIEPLDVAGSFGKNKDFREKFGDIKNGEETTTSSASTTANTSDSGEIVLLNNTKEEETDEEKTEEVPFEGDAEMPENEQAPEPDENGNMPQPPQTEGDKGNGGNTFITNKFFFNMASMNDFTVTSYSNLSKMPEYLLSLGILDNESEELNCIISKNLATENDLSKGDTFTLVNPDNESETYTFTVAGLCDTSKSGESGDTSSNASFVDNSIFISDKALTGIINSSAELNDNDGDDETKSLSPSYSGTYIFKNLKNYNALLKSLDKKYTLVSNDVSNYEQSISQLKTLSKYATYFLAVIFIIGALVLIIINILSIRNRKYEIGVLTAIGMKKVKVATQFTIELFVITFAALIIGSSIGAAVSVPVTNGLLKTVNEAQTESQTESAAEQKEQNNKPDFDGNEPKKGERPVESDKGPMGNFAPKVNNYIASVNSATDLAVILKMILVGLGITLVSSLASAVFVMRYEPLKILNNRD